jgi:3',5'-cyclic AMP phosphodiesterase CpdA
MTLKIGIFSDIHVHRADQTEAVIELVEHINQQGKGLDLLILAGDVSHVPGEIQRFLQSIKSPSLRCWIPGNHDIWVIEPENGEDTPEHRYRSRFSEISHLTGWKYLPQSPLLLESEKIAIVGSIGWFTEEEGAFSEWFDNYPPPGQDQLLARQTMNQLHKQIKGLPSYYKIILVSHHQPYGNEIGVSNGYLEKLIEQYSERIILSIHGHKHRRRKLFMVNGTPTVAHPFGYPNQHDTTEDGLLIVELPSREASPE